MSKAIFLVGGGKGGVGKSLMSMALLDFLQAGGQEPFLVETDTSVPDVFKTYQEETAGELVNLDEREGWIELVNLVESRAESAIVINTGARNQTGVSNFGRTLSKALGELGRKLVVLWMIDRKRESLELLSDFMAAIPEAEVHVVRNLYLGSEKKFELYNGSKMKSGIEGERKQVHQPAGARRPRDRRHEQRADDDRESNGGAVAGRSDGAGTVARRMRRHAVAGRQWLISRTRSISSSIASRRTASGNVSTGRATR